MEAGEKARVVCFWLGRQQFAAPIRHVKETIVLRPITRVFLTPPWLAGIINLRGEVLAVVDLPCLFGLGRCGQSFDARIVIAHSEGDDRRRAGLLVDRLGEVKRVDLRALQPTSMLSNEHMGLCHGVMTEEGGEPVAILDVPKIFESEQLRQFQRKAS